MSKTCVTLLALCGLLAFMAPVKAARAAPVFFQFNGTQTGGPASVQALLGIDSSLVVPNGTFDQSSLNFSLSVQYNGAFSASGTSPATVSGQFNNVANVFSSLFVNDPLTIPGHTGTNNFQFFGANGQSWAFGVTAPAPGQLNVQGTGAWTVAAVPVPAALWLFGSGLTAVVSLARGKAKQC